MAEQIILPRRVIDANGDPLSGAKLFAYVEGTTTLEAIYTTSALSTAHPSPLVSDSGGNFPPIWHAGDHGVKIKITDASDVEISWSPVDPCPATSSATTASNISFTPTTDNPASNVQQAIENATETGSEVSEKSSGFTIVAADIGKTFRCTAALTVSLTQAANLGNGFVFTVVAAGGDVTIDPNGVETIDGAATIVVRDGRRALVNCDGSIFFSSITPSVTEIYPDTTIDITSSTASVEYDIPSGATGFCLAYDDFEPVTADEFLTLRMGVNGSGGAFVTSSNYTQNNISNLNGVIDLTIATGTYFGISHQTDNGTQAHRGWGQVIAQGLNQAGEIPRIDGTRSAVNSSLQNRYGTFSGRLVSGNYNAIQLLCSTGNISRLRGRITWKF